MRKLFVKGLESKNSEIEYVITISKSLKNPRKTKYSISTSNSSVWNECARNEFLLAIVDNGNYIKIKKPKKWPSHVEYCESFYLLILLKLNKLDFSPQNFEIINEAGKKITTV